MAEPNPDDLIRIDRVGYYHRYGAWRRFPMQGPTYGDLWLTYDGRVGFLGVGGLMHTDAWDTQLSQIQDVSPAGKWVSFWCTEAMPNTSFEVVFAGKREVINFLGIQKFLSSGDKWIARIPGVHGAGAAAVGLKSYYQNRDAGKRAKQALEEWLAILDGSVNIAQLPRLKDVSPEEA
jgi:hypothetical protein